MTHQMPDDPDVVTDHDPAGVHWITGNVAADALGEHDVPAPGQTHRTSFFPTEPVHGPGGEAYATRPSRDDARAMLDPTCPADPDDWRVYALVPAQVADGEVREQGDPVADLMCVLALIAGRRSTDDRWPVLLMDGHRRPCHIPGAEGRHMRLQTDPDDYSPREIAQLAAWGFTASTELHAFVSRRYAI